MKTRVRSNGNGSGNGGAHGSPSQSAAPSYYKYLKPGELAQLRYSKMTARSKKIGTEALLALYQLRSSTEAALPQPHSTMEGIPCFNFRAKGFPRCLKRQKLLAVMPVFSET